MMNRADAFSLSTEGNDHRVVIRSAMLRVLTEYIRVTAKIEIVVMDAAALRRLLKGRTAQAERLINARRLTRPKNFPPTVCCTT